MRIILASTSPRRKELLEQIGIQFEVMTSHVEERISSVRPDEVVEELSCQKAEAVGELLCQKRNSDGAEESCRKEEAADEEQSCYKENSADGEGSGQGVNATEDALLVIGADTVVALDGAILGKPSDREDAIRMLERLQGREHEVYTGITLLYRAVGAAEWKVKCFHERTKVSFYPMTEAEISEYVNTGDPLDKAGAYGIQGFCARYVRGIEGDYNNVVGLPVGRVYQEIKELSEL